MIEYMYSFLNLITSNCIQGKLKSAGDTNNWLEKSYPSSSVAIIHTGHKTTEDVEINSCQIGAIKDDNLKKEIPNDFGCPQTEDDRDRCQFRNVKASCWTNRS